MKNEPWRGDPHARNRHLEEALGRKRAELDNLLAAYRRRLLEIEEYRRTICFQTQEIAALRCCVGVPEDGSPAIVTARVLLDARPMTFDAEIDHPPA